MVVFDERKCVVVTKFTPCRIVATGICSPGNDLYFLRYLSEIYSVVLDLPNHIQHNLSTLEANNLSCPSQIASYSPRDTLQREESTSLVDHSSLIQATTTQKNFKRFLLMARRMGHLNFHYLSQLSRQHVGTPNLLPAPSGVKHCDSCH